MISVFNRLFKQKLPDVFTGKSIKELVKRQNYYKFFSKNKFTKNYLPTEKNVNRFVGDNQT